MMKGDEMQDGMLFLINMKVNFPDSMAEREKESLKDAERGYSQGLQRSGVIKGIWRVAGKYENYCIVSAMSHDELHQILSSFPMFDHMTMSITPLSTHPNAIDDDFFNTVK